MTAWLVVDLDRGEILGAGREERLGSPQPRAWRDRCRRETAAPPAVWLGPRRQQAAADLLLDRAECPFTLPVPVRPAAA